MLRQSLEQAGYDLKQLQNKGDINYGEKLKPMDEEAKRILFGIEKKA